ncbi:hypothetical protein L1049_019562 [Liquidambar formosana]|uniref:CHHC U11-48K-type domain-containing protein n=1 Tax=Liquidambar formosana TaxID=63359 RepID=A0AAP0S8C2_LIQFO
MPPESLFRHSLTCPSPLDLDPLLASLRYPHTLKSSAESQKQNRFVQTLPNSDAELCFSLGDCDDFGSNFFYRDCPGVVSSSFDENSAKRTLTLPAVLSLECANFVGGGGGGGGGTEFKGFERDCLKLLASELWAVRGEIEAWNDYPNTNSNIVLRTILCAHMVKESDLMRWVIVNSPRYGVVIDVPMKDHIFLLFRLCLKAIVREAIGSVEIKEQNSEMNSKSKSFECPVLVQVLKWLASQLSVLYGEMNARDVKFEGPIERSRECELDGIVGESIYSRKIFVSQVAAAVAALHERALLEEKIKGLRSSQPVPKYQIRAEHAYVSKRAEEERQKRSNYRPILDHDGLLWQRSRQETSKTKTREELLAEERDYKRRRMSYRGKKLKRSTTQVMRDIIEEYMEEIKQAGGIGCFVKGSEEGGVFQSEPFSAHVSIGDSDEQKRSVRGSSEASRGSPHDYRKQSHSNDNVRSTRLEDSSPKNYARQKRDSHGHREHLEDHRRSISRSRRDGQYYSRKSR